MILRPVTPEDRAAIESWRYPPPYDTYDHDEPVEGDYHAAYDGAELVGYVCFGEPARIEGMEDVPGVLDVGWGLRPDLLGQGRGAGLIREALHLGRELYGPERFRIAVYDWNERARRAPAGVGFVESGRLRDFVLMERPA